MTFGFESTTDEVLDGVDLSGRKVLVTGASAGLGQETTRALAARGAAVIMAVRDLDKGERAADAVRAEVPDAELELRELDLASLASARSAADAISAAHDRIDVLIANAGVMACPQGTTADGFETQFGTNHLGHFVFVNRLAPLVADRVVVLSSLAHRRSDVDLDDPGFERTPYDKWLAYGRAKTANALYALELDRRLSARGAHAWSVHPGGIMTELGRHLTQEDIDAFRNSRPGLRFKSVPQGAATQCWAATAPELASTPGVYLEDCSVAQPNDEPDAQRGVRSYAQDPERAAALWELSERMVGESSPL